MAKQHRSGNPSVTAEQPKPDHLDELLDEAGSESFPASDPIAVTPRRTPVVPKPDRQQGDGAAQAHRQKRPG